MIAARGLRYRYPSGAMALDGLDLDVARGERVAVLGPNGAGKTTLFNLISGDHRIDRGELVFAGHPLGRQPPYRRCQMGIGRTYQIPRPYVGLTTFENLLVAASFGGGRSETASYASCSQILRDCELRDKAKQLEELVAKNPGSFSFEAGKVSLIKRSFWTPGVIYVGKTKWVFRNGIEKAHRAPLKAWADHHKVQSKGLA